MFDIKYNTRGEHSFEILFHCYIIISKLELMNEEEKV